MERQRPDRKNAEDRSRKAIQADRNRIQDDKKVSELEDAERIIERIWVMKKWADDIELELFRREYTNEAQTADAGTN